MNILMIDVTDIPGVEVGDEVTLLDSDGEIDRKTVLLRAMITHEASKELPSTGPPGRRDYRESVVGIMDPPGASVPRRR